MHLFARRPVFFVPLLALLGVLPFLTGGVSQGHDFTFHLQGWLDAAAQLREGVWFPHWARSAAWQAGEPRFLFYPPLSWSLGALLLLIFPAAAVPVVYVWLAFTGAGLAMYRLAREFTPPSAALIAAAFYLVNPYMIFNSFERSAYAEVLAATSMPLLLLGALKRRPTIFGIALPFAMVWLTNAPSAVMGTYMLALVFAFRVIDALRTREPALGKALAIKAVAGMSMGFALAAFYIVPVLFERRFVQIDMAIMPNLRYQDSFLFSRTSYEPHNIVTRTASVLAVSLLCLAVAALALAWWQRRRAERQQRAELQLLVAATLLTVTIAFLLVPVSGVVWEHVPELKFLQFPWRLLTVLSVVVGLVLAMCAQALQGRRLLTATLVLLITVGQAYAVGHLYRQANDSSESAAALARAFLDHHGVPATDEYTARGADNDLLRTDNPGYWLAKQADDPAPGTTPNPNETEPDYDAPLPPEHTIATQAPMHLDLNLPAPEVLVLNLRDFHDWQVRRNAAETLPELHREDGLIAVALPAGHSVVDVQWHQGWGAPAGLTLTALGGCGLVVIRLRSRKLKHKAHAS